jgi:uncharacterized protein (TIGR02246 family)
MRKLFPIALVTALVLACAGSEATNDAAAAAAAAPDTAALRVELKAQVDAYGAAVLAGDAAALTAMYTDDATVEITAVPTLIGRAAIMAADSANFAAGKPTEWSATVRTVVPIGGGAVAQTGSWSDAWPAPGGKVARRAGRWVSSSQKGEDGKWRIGYLMAMIDSTVTK